jgi:hypothetical protein
MEQTMRVVLESIQDVGLWPFNSVEYKYNLSANLSDVQEFINEISIKFKLIDWRLFLSIRLHDINGLGKQYEINSPWCYPIALELDGRSISRLSGSAGELPDFDSLKKITEYKIKQNK